MSYEKFAYLYDELMIDAPYDQWVSFVLRTINQYSLPLNSSLLDLGCGTGNIAIPLSKVGLKVTAVDLSEEMLFVAKEKSEANEASIQFFQQDMRDLEGLGQFDVVVSLCDSLNYLHDELELQKTFQNVYQHLKNQGLFIFDVHSVYKVDEVFAGSTFAYNGEDISYIWECFSGDEDHTIEHELSFFVKNEVGLYERFDEVHKQRTYPLSIYKNSLEKTGFEVISITGDFSNDVLSERSERLFFIAKKL